MEIRPFEQRDADQVVALWHQCGLTRDWNDPRLDIERKLTTQPELFLVGELDNRVMATAMAGYDGHRGWVNYLAVAAEQRGQGHGRRLMAEVERLLEDRGCPKLNIQVRAENTTAIGFYRSIGYLEDASISLGKRLIAD